MKTKKAKGFNYILGFLGGVGYLASLFQWLGIAMLYLPSFFESNLGKQIFPENEVPEPTVVVQQTQTDPSAALILLSSIGAVVVVGLLVYLMFFYYPRAVTKTASRIVHKTTNLTVPIIERKMHHKPTAKRRRVLTERLLLWLKLSLALIPVGLIKITDWHDESINHLIFFTAISLLALIAVISFFAQAILARKWHSAEADII